MDTNRVSMVLYHKDKLLVSSGDSAGPVSYYGNAPKYINITYNSHYIIAIMYVTFPSERQRTGSITNVRIPPKSIVYSLYKVEMSRANGANLSICFSYSSRIITVIE